MSTLLSRAAGLSAYWSFLETNVSVRVCMSVCLHPCGFPHDFETDMIGLVRKQADEDFVSSQFECEVKRASTGEKCYSQIQLP